MLWYHFTVMSDLKGVADSYGSVGLGGGPRVSDGDNTSGDWWRPMMVGDNCGGGSSKYFGFCVLPLFIDNQPDSLPSPPNSSLLLLSNLPSHAISLGHVNSEHDIMAVGAQDHLQQLVCFFITHFYLNYLLFTGAQWTVIVTTIAIEKLKSGMVEVVVCVQRTNILVILILVSSNAAQVFNKMPQRNFMADTWASSQGAMFESVLQASCQIIDYGWTWTKDRAPVDTFIMGLATSIREHNDYEEEDNAKEKPAVPIVQLNVIRLLAELNVQVKISEVGDTILPLFIESLEEGEASTPSLLCLRV
ncbi:hypothetical protein L2E82_04498 [Cichorium intybus]|uniref:Uncharacterized protein n=1 Tax=Cichorium intybus TaxID=13427 RepID=A0ACB9H760_CICIN|nr:hypothetical protein L2E82_04498 [Cichorium intybus]